MELVSAYLAITHIIIVISEVREPGFIVRATDVYLNILRDGITIFLSQVFKIIGVCAPERMTGVWEPVPQFKSSGSVGGDKRPSCQLGFDVNWEYLLFCEIAGRVARGAGLCVDRRECFINCVGLDLVLVSSPYKAGCRGSSCVSWANSLLQCERHSATHVAVSSKAASLRHLIFESTSSCLVDR